MELQNQNNQQTGQIQASPQTRAQISGDGNSVSVVISGGLAGIAGIGDVRAILSWSNLQRKISLQKEDDTTPTGLVFSVNYSQVTRADFALNSVKLHIDDRSYMLLINADASLVVNSPAALLTVGGGPAIFLGTADARRAGFDALRQGLQAAGVKTTKPNLLKLALVTTGVVFGVLILLVVVMMIVAG